MWEDSLRAHSGPARGNRAWSRVGSRYYSGVRILRTTISCVAVAIVSVSHVGRVTADGLFFPLLAKWTDNLERPPSFPAAYDDTQAYVASRDNYLVALSVATGTIAWSVECPTTAAPAAGDGFVFAGSDGAIEARSPADGTVRWRTAIEGKVNVLYWDAGWLIATTDKGSLLAVRAADGGVLWQRDLESALQAAPAPAGDRLYLATQSGALMALALNTGESIWTIQLVKPASGILALGDRLYLGSLDKNFYCVSTKKGDIEWRWKTGAYVVGVPAIDTRTVYFVSLDNVLRALDRNSGSMRWSRSMTTRPSAGPILAGWTLIVPGITSELHAFSSMSGAPIGDFVLLSPQGLEMQFFGPPHLAADDMVVTLTKGGHIQGSVGSPSPFGP